MAFLEHKNNQIDDTRSKEILEQYRTATLKQFMKRWLGMKRKADTDLQQVQVTDLFFYYIKLLSIYIQFGN